MAPPSRMYVGVFVFGLITTLSIAAYGALMLSGYRPPPESPFEAIFPADETTDWGEILFVALAFVFAATFTALVWRMLVAGARRDVSRREDLAEARRQTRRQTRR